MLQGSLHNVFEGMRYPAGNIWISWQCLFSSLLSCSHSCSHFHSHWPLALGTSALGRQPSALALGLSPRSLGLGPPTVLQTTRWAMEDSLCPLCLSFSSLLCLSFSLSPALFLMHALPRYGFHGCVARRAPSPRMSSRHIAKGEAFFCIPAWLIQEGDGIVIWAYMQ